MYAPRKTTTRITLAGIATLLTLSGCPAEETSSDAGTNTGSDTGTSPDSGSTPDTGKASDSGTPTDSGTEPDSGDEDAGAGGPVDYKDLILTNMSGDCADHATTYFAAVADIQRVMSFDSDVVITAGTDSCTLTSNNIPNHDFNDDTANFATPVSEQSRSFALPRSPQAAAAPTALAQRTFDGVYLNGVPLDLLSAGCYDPDGMRPDENGNVAIGCSVDDDWLLDPLGTGSRFGADIHNAHTQPDGTYHYHGGPEALFDDSPGPLGSPVIGFAADGFPIYGSYFVDGEGTVRKATSGWALRDGERPTGEGNPGGTYDGLYIDDWEFTGAGDLDRCNGMTVDGQYGYYVTDAYPWVLGCLTGTPDPSFSKGGGPR